MQITSEPIRRGSISQPALAPRPKKPIVIFDMAFRSPRDKRFPHTVSGAALPLALALRQVKVATPYFLPRPLTMGGRIDLPKGLSLDDRPIVFALSVYDDLFKEIQAEVQFIKENFPQAKIILGGSTVNTAKDLPGLASFFPEADALVRGEGEGVLPELVNILTGKKSPAGSNLPGVFLNSNGYYCSNNAVCLIEDKSFSAQPTIIAFPSLVRGIKKGKKLDLHTSRGCPYRCIFCVTDKLRRQPIYWSADRIIDELFHIKNLIQRGVLPPEARQINFTDDDFFFDRQRAVDFLTSILASPALKNYFRFVFQGGVRSFFITRDGLSDRETILDQVLLNLLGRLKSRTEISLGTDGFHNQTLKELGKPGYTIEMAISLATELGRIGIMQRHFVILFTPQMTMEILDETLRNLSSIIGKACFRLHFSFNYFLQAYESSRLRDQLLLCSNEKNVLVSSTGARKYLPLCLSPNEALNVILEEALDFVINRRELEHSWVKGDDKRFREMNRLIWRKALPSWKKLKGKTIREALQSSNCFLQFVALCYFREVVKALAINRPTQ